jgi:nucleotide-binding universal stress UspA family protein
LKLSLVSNWRQSKFPTSANDSAARANFGKLPKRKKLKPEDCRFIVARGTNFADVIAKQAKKLRAAMIVMGSHGRTGLQRFLLGSVAERTLRYADCPVLIVKK